MSGKSYTAVPPPCQHAGGFHGAHLVSISDEGSFWLGCGRRTELELTVTAVWVWLVGGSGGGEKEGVWRDLPKCLAC